jgi:hypothetical protein
MGLILVWHAASERWKEEIAGRSDKGNLRIHHVLDQLKLPLIFSLRLEITHAARQHGHIPALLAENLPIRVLGLN